MGHLPPGRFVDDQGLLIIRDVTVSDSGVYICQVTDGIDVGYKKVTLSVGRTYRIITHINTKKLNIYLSKIYQFHAAFPQSLLKVPGEQ